MNPIFLIAALSTPTSEVFFDFDSARIPEGTSAELQKFVEFTADHPYAKIVIDGNTDSIGSSEYNIGLSIRRAQNVQSTLKRLGVDGDRLILVGYGENGLRRTTNALDRRVVVWTTEDPLYVVIDHALSRATTVFWDEPVFAASIDGPRPTQTAFR
jgi:outer membrane protein OmpA-like peptidoglycan-associated protein